MTWIMVDIEADGQIPGDYSMVALGAVVVEPALNRTFYRQMKPISMVYEEEALKVTGFTRDETWGFEEPGKAMESFRYWLETICISKSLIPIGNAGHVKQDRPMFISDNNGFDWQFVNWYFHHFLGHNPFGHSSTNLGSLFKGIMKDTHARFKKLRETKHTHNPVDDAMGNAEALLKMKNNYGLRIDL